MAVMSAFYSIQYMEHYPDYRLWGYYLCFPLFILGMVGIVTVDDLSTGFTHGVAGHDHRLLLSDPVRVPESGNVRNANKYLVLMELAWLLILGGAFFIGGYRFGDPCRDGRKIGPTGGCRSSGSSGSSWSGSASRPASFPSASSGCPTRTPSRRRPSAPCSPAS